MRSRKDGAGSAFTITKSWSAMSPRSEGPCHDGAENGRLPERGQAMAAKFGARRVYSDHQALLADPEVQMVDVCTPTHTHLSLSRDAIAAGKHVLSEKPLATEAAPAFD